MLITNILTAVNSIVLFLLLYFRVKNSISNKLLAFIFLIPGLYFIDNILLIEGYIYKLSFFFFFVQIIASIYPIVIHLYVSKMIGIQSKPHWLLLLGSCLLLIYIIFITIFFYRSSEEAQKQFISSLLTTEYPIQISLYTSFFYFWQMVYLSSNTYVIFKLFRNNQKQKVKTLPQHFDFIIKFVGLFWILNLLLLSLYILLPIYVVDCIYLPICVSIIYTFILYYSYHFSFDLNGAIHETSTNIEEKKPFVSKKQVLSETNNEKCRIIHTLIESALEKDKIYLNPDLTLKELSDQIGYPSYLVSHTINSYFKKNFFELINEKRILEAERRIKLSTGIEKIESIAYDVGFNSRTSFYRAYKKHLGHTPIVRNSLTDNE